MNLLLKVTIFAALFTGFTALAQSATLPADGVFRSVHHIEGGWTVNEDSAKAAKAACEEAVKICQVRMGAACAVSAEHNTRGQSGYDADPADFICEAKTVVSLQSDEIKKRLIQRALVHYRSQSR
jgi:hypothetical protein